MSQIRKESFNMVDLMKFIMAILVVIIHRPIFPADNNFINYMSGNIVCAIAVPFFFIASSFFFFKSALASEQSKGKLTAFLKRIFTLYLLWTIIYLPCIFVKNHTGHYDEITIKFIIGEIIRLIYNFFFDCSFVHFWYLTTLMLSVAVVYLLYKKFSFKATIISCLCITVLWYIFTFASETIPVCSSVYDLIPTLFKNTLGKGLLCTSAGLFSVKYYTSISKKMSYVLCALSAVCMLFTGYFTYSNNHSLLWALCYFFVVFTSFSIFILCLKIKLKPSPVYQKLRAYSILIYFSHLLLLSEAYNYVAEITGFAVLRDSNILQFIITAVFALLFSACILFLQKKGCDKLKYLY